LTEEPGRRGWRRVGGGLVAATLTALALLLFADLAVDGLWRRDAFDHAQIAREITEGRGFSSRQITSGLQLRFLEDRGLLQADWPIVNGFPLASLGIAALSLVLGVGNAAVVGYGIICQSLLSLLLYLWARRALGMLAAIGTVFLFTVNGVLLEIGCAGLAEPPVMLFFTLSLYALYRMAGGGGTKRIAWLLVSGVAFGLAVLGRTHVVLALPLFCAWIVFFSRGGTRPALSSRRGLVEAALLVVLVFLVQVPWLLRNLEVTGSPFFSLHTDFVPPLHDFKEHGDLVLARSHLDASELLADLSFFGGTFLVPLLALVSLFWPVGRGLRSLGWLVVGSFLVTAIPLGFTDGDLAEDCFHCLPFLLLLGAGVTAQLLSRFLVEGSLLAVFSVVMLVLTNLPGLVAGYRRVSSESEIVVDKQMEFIADHADRNAVIFSNQSFAITWKTGRRTIRHHVGRNEAGATVFSVLSFQDEFLPIDGVYFSGAFMGVRANRNVLHDTQDERFRRLFPRRRTFRDGAVFFWRGEAGDGEDVTEEEP